MPFPGDGLWPSDVADLTAGTAAAVAASTTSALAATAGASTPLSASRATTAVVTAVASVSGSGLTAGQITARKRKLALPRLRGRSRGDFRVWQIAAPGVAPAVAATSTVAATAAANVSSPASASRATAAAVTAAAGTGSAAALTVAVSAVATSTVSSPASAARVTTAVVTATARASSPAAVSHQTAATAAATGRGSSLVTGFRTIIPPQKLPRRGAQVVFAAADSFNGMRFPNSGRSVLVLRNTNAAPVTCTVWYSPALDPTGHTQGRQVVIPAGTDAFTTAVFPPAAFNQDTGQVDLDFTTATGMSVAVIEGYRRW